MLVRSAFSHTEPCFADSFCSLFNAHTRTFCFLPSTYLFSFRSMNLQTQPPFLFRTLVPVFHFHFCFVYVGICVFEAAWKGRISVSALSFRVVASFHAVPLGERTSRYRVCAVASQITAPSLLNRHRFESARAKEVERAAVSYCPLLGTLFSFYVGFALH